MNRYRSLFCQIASAAGNASSHRIGRREGGSRTHPSAAPSSRKALGWWAGAARCLLVLGLVGATLSAFAADPEPPAFRPLPKRGVLTVGVATDNYPFSFLGENGRITGFSIELFRAVAQEMNLEFHLQQAPRNELFARFVLGKIDILTHVDRAALDETASDFVIPYLTQQRYIWVHRNDAKNRSLEFLGGKPVAIVAGGSKIRDQFLALGISPVFHETSTAEEALHGVETGRFAAAVLARLSADVIIREKKLLNVVKSGAPLADHPSQQCLAVRTGDTELLGKLQEGMLAMEQNGELNRIYEHWFERIDEPLVSRNQLIGTVGATVALLLLMLLWVILQRRKLSTQAEQLAVSQVFRQIIKDHIPLAFSMIEHDTEGPRLLTINRGAERFYQIAAVSAYDRMLKEIKGVPGWIDLVLDVLSRWPAQGAILQEEHPLDSGNLRLAVTLVPLPDGPGGVRRVCMLAEDVTEIRLLDQEVAQSRKLGVMGQLVGGIANELNNIITPIQLNAELLRRKRGTDTGNKPELMAILSSTERAAGMIRQLMALGTRTGSAPVAQNLQHAVETNVELISATSDRRILWDNATSDKKTQLWLNPGDLDQIVLNLLLNAREALTEKLAANSKTEWTPRIRIETTNLPVDRLSSTDGLGKPVSIWQRLIVQDNGVGMPDEVRKRIFEPYFTTKTGPSATGLGMTAVMSAVEKCGGRIEVTSAVGEGTTFAVYFPVRPVTEEKPIAADSFPPFQPGALRILLAEDDGPMASVMTAVLQGQGHSVVNAANGFDAWHQLKNNLGDYDLIISDVNMPGIDGREFALRARRASFKGSIMLISGYFNESEIAPDGTRLADVLLLKPFSHDQLLSAIRKLASSGQPPTSQP